MTLVSIILLVSVFFIIEVTSYDTCVDDTYPENQMSYRKYVVGKQKVTFDEAVLLCLQYGMEIASPLNPEEGKAVASAWLDHKPGLGETNGAWIGARRHSNCVSQFVWVQSGKPIVYSDWDEFYDMWSRTSPGACVQIANKGNETKWMNFDCSKPSKYVCQTRLDNNYESREERKACSRSYVIGYQLVTFDDAVTLCKQIDMEIASPMSEAEERNLENTFKGVIEDYNGHKIWIGAKRCKSCTSDFHWIASGKPMVYRHFFAKKYDKTPGDEDCVILHHVLETRNRHLYAWNDVKCDERFGFACQSKCFGEK